MNKYYISFVSVLLIVLNSCTTETELRKSVFIPDKDFPGLPEYSEWGYNTFGAYYDRAPFVSMDFAVPSKVEATGDQVLFTLEGHRRVDGFTNLPIKIEFVLPQLSIETYDDLITLHQQSYDLTELIVRVETDEGEFEADVVEGQIEFVRAQNLWVDRRKTEVILSGRFSFKGIVNGESVSISEGRFDVGIGNDNFFNFN
jgi:hypothetical protein